MADNEPSVSEPPVTTSGLAATGGDHLWRVAEDEALRYLIKGFRHAVDATDKGERLLLDKAAATLGASTRRAQTANAARATAAVIAARVSGDDASAFATNFDALAPGYALSGAKG